MKDISLSELTRNPYDADNEQSKNQLKQLGEYLTGKINSNQKILDIGRRSPATDYLEKFFNVKVENTDGDLDLPGFLNTDSVFDVIIFSHTIEHLFAPLNTLLELKKYMHSGGKDSYLYIILPSRPKFLWSKQHFHEIDNYRMKLLLERAGFEVLEYSRLKMERGFFDYIRGIRMFLRLFFEFNAYYKCKIIQS